MSDALAVVFDEFADAAEQQLVRMAGEIRALRDDLAAVRAETRAAALVSGPAGPQGEPGPQGDAGPQGEPGPAGPAGDRGPDGVQGPAGERGADGLQGRDGAQGELGPMGPVGAQGERGERGERGEPGIEGRAGDAGPQGPAGDCGADGVGSVEEIRAIAGELVRAAFVAHVRGFYQGVYRTGSDYTMGQATTWDGSMWVAARDTNSKPGADDSWILAVKRGRDGKR